MEHKNKKGQHKIAIVGTGSLFPGAINTKDFWLNILAEKDFIKDVPETHWLKEDYYDPTDKSGDKVYCKKGAFLGDIPFDPVEFGMPPNLLSTTDTVQLLSLVVARDTLADTLSYQEGKVDKKKISVILGVAGGTELIGQMSARIHKPEWVMAMRNQGLPESKIEAITKDLDKCYTKWTENTFPGLLGNVVSGRIANRFDFKGTNCVLDAACASSLAAVKMAVQELQLGSTDMVISGGADALNDIFMYMCFSKTTALSPTEDCRPFSDEGDGTVLGEAVVMLALKRLEDAERDGDRIYAVISSIGSSSDGKSGSIYAPDSNGQSLAIKRAYEDAGVSSNEISLVEGHGTGTMAGDHAEFNGLKLGYGETEQKQYCALGSVKSMVGHTKSAAGAASLLKVAMALNNAVLPPTIKVKRPNPKLNIEETPFYLNTVARPWIHDGSTSRKAGVSSMGFGGTNFHVVMEEYDNKNHRPNKIYRQGRELILLSGKSQTEITDALNKLVGGGSAQDLVQLAKSTQETFNPSDNCRLAILGESIAEIFKWSEHVKSELAKKLSKIEVNNCAYYTEGKPSGDVAFLFSGQGSQYLNMGTDLVMQYEEAMGPWNKASMLKLDVNKRLNNVVFPIPVFTEEEKVAQATLLVDTKWAQPAIGVLALSHFNLLSKLNVKPVVTGGHSYGEVAALYAAGIITSEEDLIAISRKRGELMAAASKEKGAMTAVFASEKVVSEILKKAKTKVVIANVNSPTQTVVTGVFADIEKIEIEIEKAGLRFQRLNVSTAFHSELVSNSAAEFEAYLKKISFGKSTLSVYSNTTASPYPKKASDYASVLANQLAAPVQFEKQVKAMYEEGARVFIELGPGKVLSNFVKDILQDQPHKAISIDGGKKQNSKDAFWIALGQLAAAGVPLSFAELWKGIDDNKKVVIEKKPSVATVKINGSNYGKPYPPVGGFKSLPKPNPEIIESQKQFSLSEVKREIVSVPSMNKTQEIVDKKTSSSTTVNQTLTNRQTQPIKKMSGVNDQWLNAFQEIQKNTLEAQKNFQETLAQSHKIFLETSQIAFQQLGSVSGNGITQTNRISVVEQTPQIQVSKPQPVVQKIIAEAQPIVVAPVVAQPVYEQKEVVKQSSASNANMEDTILSIVAEKTGYPKEILDLSTDLESGLGIDSIKRVEILSALQEVFPELKNVDKAKLAAMNTLGEILNFSKANTSSSTSTSAETAKESTNETVGVPDDFEDVMMQIVAEKTGYPKEILDLNTDLESGLGIDSIKRVEILSALQEKFPSLKNADRAKLAAMNTLGEILAFAGNSTSSNVGGVSENTGKKSLRSANIFRYIVNRTSIADSGFGISTWKKADVLYLLEDDLGVAKQLEKLFKAVGAEPKVVSELPGEASYVINLRGLNKFTNSSVEQVLAINADAFHIAQVCGKKLFEGSGCLILPFDNGLSHKTKNNRAWSGGISALAKTAKLEWPNADVQSINIDCSEKTPAVIAQEIFQVITSGGHVTEVEIDKEGYTYQLTSSVATIADRSKALNDGDTIIVSGGAKGVTAACLIALSERKKINIGILGRTTLEEEPAYLAVSKTDAELKNSVFQQAIKEGRKITPPEVNSIVSKILSNREVVENIRAITNNGSVVRYLSADISNKEEVIKSVEVLRKEFGSIQGIVHAAGVLADKYIHEKTADQFNKVFNTKITGFINMLEATAKDKLTHICCFSSVAARMGNVGQVDYAMANEVLNKVCQAEQKKRKNSCVVKSLNWGPWDGGMVSPQLKKHFESLGVDLIPLQTGAEIFADEMEDSSIENVEIVVGGAFDMWGKKDGSVSKHIQHMWVHQSNSAFLDSHKIQGKVIVPMMMANEWSMRLAKSVCPDLKIVEVNNVKVYKGIQLDNFDKGGDFLRFVYIIERNKEVSVVKIKIEDEKGQMFYSVTVNLTDEFSYPSKSIIELKNLQSWTWKKKDIYNARLFHGPDFQVVEKLEGIAEDGCKGILKISNSDIINNKGWLSDMFLFDGGIQLAVLAMDKWTGNNSSLPLGYDSLRLYDQSKPAAQMNCELALKKKGDMDSEWDILFKDKDQKVLAEMTGLRIYMYKMN